MPLRKNLDINIFFVHTHKQMCILNGADALASNQILYYTGVRKINFKG